METGSCSSPDMPCVGAVIVQYGDSDIAALLLRLRDDARVAATVVVRNPRDAQPPAPAPDATVHLPTNRGYAAAVNQGRRCASLRGLPYHLVLTHDADLDDGAVAALVAAMESDQDVAIAGPQLEDKVAGTVTVGAERSRWGQVRHRRIATALPADAAPIRTTWIDGAVMLLRSSLVGDFDERYFLYVEDVAICLSVRPHAVVVVPGARARQQSGNIARPGGHAYLLARNHLLLAGQLGDPWARSKGVVRGVGSGLAQLVRAVRTPSHRHYLRQAAGTAWGTWDGLRGVTGPPPVTLQRWGDIDGIGSKPSGDRSS